MKAKIITYLDRENWNNFVAYSAHNSILQSYEWGELKAKFGWQPIRVALEDNGKIVAGVSILKREIPLIKHSLFYAPRGPIIDYGNRDLLHALLDVLEEQSDRHHAISLKIDPDLEENDLLAIDNLRSLGFDKALKQIQPRATFLLNIEPELDDLMGSFAEKTRYNIRLAEKKGVYVKEDNSEKGIEMFYALYAETAKRDKFLIHPLSYYRKIREIIFRAGLGSCFIAFYEGKPVSAVITFNFGSRLWYMYGASSSEYRNVMPNHILHWKIIKWAKARGLKEYDLWGIPVKPEEGHPLFGVYRFKKGFNGELKKYIGAYDFPYSPLFFHAFEHGVVWWQNLRSLMTKGKFSDSLGE
ncbi:MAG: peptidoglycan bridge formation glycyltransferase FemA/FemB family protein [Candidatus Margulisiibacteriota bacterium]|jgi:lipid II:glycine glycyltransferase (peptidoglycan interpeptide bridge formation enzyme)